MSKTQQLLKSHGHETLSMARAQVYHFLARCFGQRPDDAFVQRLLSPRTRQLLRNALGDNASAVLDGLQLINRFLDDHHNTTQNDLGEKLSVDFTKLTRGLHEGYGPAPPYESVWKGEAMVMGPTTQRVVQFYQKAPLSISLWNQPPDHIANELRFMALLCEQEKQSWACNRNQVLSWLRLEKEFLEVHLLTWAPSYLAEAAAQAQTDFWRGVARLSSSFLRSDHDLVAHLLAEANL